MSYEHEEECFGGVDGAVAEKICVKIGHHRVTWDVEANLPDGFECDSMAVKVKVEGAFE